MSKVYTAAEFDLHKEKILSALKTVVNDLTGIEPEQVDIHANFMEVGIDSLMMIQATQLVKELYDVKLSVVQLLEQLTNLDALASYIAQELPPETLPEIAASSENSALIAEPEVPATPPVPPVTPVQPAPAPYTQPMQTFVPEVKPVMREVYPNPSGAMNGGGQPSTSALDQIMSQQLQLMARQLDMLNASYATMVPRSQVEDHPTAILPQLRSQTADQEKVAPAREVSESKSVTGTIVTAPAPESNVRNQPVYIPYQPIEPGPTSGLTERQQRHLDDLIERLNSRTRESKRLTQENRPYLSDSRSSFNFRLLWKELVYPIIADHSAGSKVWDVDGNEYVDVSMGFGVHLFGHSPDFIDAAMKNQIDSKSVQLGPQVFLAGKVARLFSEVTGQERVNFCNSGTEAVMAAMRLARTVTQRSRIAIFGGAYHGWSDSTLAKAGSGRSEGRSVPMAPGISAKAVEDVVVLDWDSPTAIEYLKEHIHELAAVMVEPVQSRRPDIQPRAFLHQLRELTTSAGTALIFDEMITGFRIHVGGAQAWFGVQADISTYGKVIGGGLPIGVIAGKAAFLDAFDGGLWKYGDESYPQAIKTIFAGAFFKHPLTMAASQAVLHHLRDNPSLLPDLNERTTRLVATLNRTFAEAELPVEIVNFASLFRFMFAPELKFVDLFFYHMLNEGIFIWEGRNCFLSTAHSEEDLSRIVQAVERSIAEMRAGGFWPGPSGKHSGSEPSTQTSIDGTSDSRTVASEKNNGQGQTPVSSVAAEPLTTPAYVVDQAVKTPPTRASIVAPKFSLSYFGNYQSAYSADKYELLFEGAKYADEHGFEAVWIPERHFHSYGGFSPNPSVVAAALARETQRVCIRAGSVVLPLHNPIRVAEEWSVVDNLSHGRIGISFASGWQPNDFVFAPEAYANRHEHMYRGIEMVQQLWSGKQVTARSGDGKEIKVGLAPMPMQRQLPAWLTGASPGTFTKAGELGLRFLTNLQDQSIEELAEKIAHYRATLARHGHDSTTGHVTVLLHTFIGDDIAQVRETARQPLYRYMRSSLALMSNRVKGSKNKPLDLDALASEDLEYILASGYRRYSESASLIGTPESCAALIDRLVAIGVDEIACMIDFGIDTQTVVDNLRHLSRLRERYQNSTPRLITDVAANAPAIVKDGPTSTEPIIDVVVEPPTAEGNKDLRLIPLTDAQRQLWITTQIGPDASRAYNESVTLRMRGPFEPDAMRRALAQLIERHELLRATFSAAGEYQIIHPSLTIDVPMLDFSQIESDARETEAAAWIEKEVSEPFDLERGPLVRFRMVKMDEQLHLLAFNNHHLVADGQSWPVLLKDLETLYSAARRGVAPQLPPPRRFDEYVKKLDKIQGHSDAHTSEEYWLKLFQDSVPVLRLPTDRMRPPVQTYNGKHLIIPTDASLFERVKQICATQGSTLYMTLLAAYSALLHRLSGQHKIIVGVPAAGQLAAGCKDTVGYCVNLLPLLSDASDNPSFAEYLATIKHNLMESLEHQHYSFGNLLKRLDIPWDPSRSPLFTTIFNIDRAGTAVKFFDLEVEVIGNSTSWARYDLRMNLIESEDKLLIDCTFNTDLFDESTIRRWMDYFQMLLRGVCADPATRVHDLPLMTETQVGEMLVTWNNTATQQPAVEGFHRLFEAQADSSPESVAVVVEDEQLSYRDLNVRANRLARYLRGRGIGPEIPVALYLERSADTIVALLAVMKAGGVYVPLDPAHPPERLRFALTDCGARVVLTHEQRRKAVEGCEAELICLDTQQSEWAEESAENLQSGAGPSNLTYLIYTSGSTGRPKGVAIEHRQLLNYVRSVSHSLSLPEGGKFATVSTLAADLGHTMLFPALCGGGTLHLITEDRLINPDALAGYFERHQIDCLKIVPSHLEALLTARHPEQVLPRRRLILGGEVAQPALLARLGELEPACEVFNHYGPTEATVGVLTFHVPKTRLQAPAAEAAALPLGHPIANTRVYVLDAHGQPVPPGIYGELYVGGAGVARGYYNRPELTAERFVPDPFSGEQGARLYRTGDIGRHLPDGELEFAGRTDNQVKISGQRIELGEIEGALGDHPAVREAVVLARNDTPGELGLVAYVVAQREASASVSELREHLRQRLPPYMQPAAFVMLDKMPLTPNGKIDRHALPAPDTTRPEMDQAYEQPRTITEEQLAQIWSEVLRIEHLGVYDNFFDLGGNSLLATKMTARVRDRFQVELTLRNLFESPTIAQLSALIVARQATPEAVRPEAVAAPRTSVDQLLSNVDHLPEAEIDSLLEELLAEEEAM